MSNVVFFSGTDGYLNCGSDASLQLTTVFTFDTLVKKRKVKDANYPTIIGKWDAGAGGKGYIFGILYDGRLFVDPNAATYITTVYPCTDSNRWYRLSISWVAGAGFKFYVDGNLIYTSAIYAGPIVDSGTALLLGSNLGGLHFWQGDMAEVLIYNRQLTDDEILYNYFHPSKPKRRGLVMNLNQDSIYGTQWRDLSGNPNHGTYTGATAPPYPVTANRLAGR